LIGPRSTFLTGPIPRSFTCGTDEAAPTGAIPGDFAKRIFEPGFRTNNMNTKENRKNFLIACLNNFGTDLTTEITHFKQELF
jgi:hypothetical protein